MSPLFGLSILKILSRSTSSLKSTFIKNFSLFRKNPEIKETTPYIIVRANKEDYEEILDVMHDGYYDGEPTISSLNIPPNSTLDEKAVHAMSEGFTLVAKCKYNGCIVGACINESTNPWDPEMIEKLACQVQCEDLRKLLMFYSYMMAAPDLWRCLGVNKIYEMAYLFVKRPHRKKGLAYRLLNKSKTLGADSGFSVIRCDATNVHTARICERLAMQKIGEIPYCSYLDKNLTPIFKPPWPHESVKIYCDCAPQFHELKNKIKKKSSFLNIFSSKKQKSKED